MSSPYFIDRTLDMCSVDFTGHWQPGAIFRAMQDASNAHCVQLNVTFEDMQKQGLAWVLTRASLVMDEYPILNDTVTIRTWPTANRHTFFPRHYTFSCNGRDLGRATALYVLLDLETRKIALPSRLSPPIEGCDIKPPLPVPGSIAQLDVLPKLESYTPVYTDFDMNSHVNNTRYVDCFMNRFPYERHQNEELAQLLIHYQTEVRHDQDLTLALREADNVSVMQGLNGDTQHFAVQGVWRSRR